MVLSFYFLLHLLFHSHWDQNYKYNCFLLHHRNNNNNQHGVCIRDFTFLLETMTVENDQKLSTILEEFHLTDKFKILEINHVRSRPSLEKLDLRTLLLRSLQFVFTKEDFNNLQNLLQINGHSLTI